MTSPYFLFGEQIMMSGVHRGDGSTDEYTDATETDTATETEDEPTPRGVVNPRLPPLQSPPHSNLPPVSVPHTTTAGSPKPAMADTIISVPEGGRYVPEETGAGIISVPGDSTQEQPKAANRGARGKPIDMVIYFHDKTGIHLTVEDGQRAEAGELFEMVMEEMKFPNEAREAFSLWLVSDYLELQLKPNHVPFKLACYWEELLEKYTTAEEDDRERDEPVIMFMRNVFYPRSKEKKLNNLELLRLLYYEAKENVIDGRYPVEEEQYDMLAGLQCLIKHRLFNPGQHTPEYYRNHITEYYPYHLSKTKWSFPGFRSKESPEFRLVEWHQTASNKYGKLEDPNSFLRVYMSYLDFCWKLPFYGASFFKGQIEHPSNSKFRIRSLDDDPVYIAVNTDGVFILDMDDVVFLMGLTFNQLSWEYAEPRNKDNPDCMSCLFLQFEATEQREKVTKLLQVFSKEAILMDAMIEACIKLKDQESKNINSQESRDEEQMIMKATGETWKRFNRLCLATFDHQGSLMNNNARVPKPN